MSRQRVFYDSEFTGLHQDTTLISLALVSEQGDAFYAEFTDFNTEQVDAFIREQVLAHTLWLNGWSPDTDRLESLQPRCETAGTTTRCLGDRAFIRQHLRHWLDGLGECEIWADHVAYDWVLFCELFGGALSLPDSVYWIPQDLCTFLACHGLDPAQDRRELAGGFFDTELSGDNQDQVHNALFDARVSMACYQRVCRDAAV